MTFATTLKDAETLAAQLRAKALHDDHFRLRGHPRHTVDFNVAVYPDGTRPQSSPVKWGIVERWIYSDRPELGEFGGAFSPLSDLRRYLDTGFHS